MYGFPFVRYIHYFADRKRAGIRDRWIAIQAYHIKNLNQVYYDTSFSNVADVDLEQTQEERMESAGIIRIVPICSMGIVILLGAFISTYKINKVLQYEPIDMLGMRKD